MSEDSDDVILGFPPSLFVYSPCMQASRVILVLVSVYVCVCMCVCACVFMCVCVCIPK